MVTQLEPAVESDDRGRIRSSHSQPVDGLGGFWYHLRRHQAVWALRCPKRQAPAESHGGAIPHSASPPTLAATTITIVIPACGRPETLARCLSALPVDADVIVSDDSRDDRVRSLVARDFPRVRHLHGPRRGPAANRNRGAGMAVGEWIAFVDDDCEPQPGWLDALAAAAAGCDVVEGRTLAPGARDTPFEEHVENLHGGLLWSCNLAIRRDRFAALGGFDEDFGEAGGEDMELAWRIARARLEVRFAPEALVFHPPRRIGWRGLWRRTWMIRWMPLYYLKTGQARPIISTALREMGNLVRHTFHLVSRPEPRRWRRRWFAVGWEWLTFPLVLPWGLYWNLRFRRMLRDRENARQASAG